MKTYRMNAVMAGALYFLGTIFGVTGAIVGGEVLASIVTAKPLVGVDMLDCEIKRPRIIKYKEIKNE